MIHQQIQSTHSKKILNLTKDALRNANKLTIPYKGKFNDYKEETFSYFFSQFINEVIGDKT